MGPRGFLALAIAALCLAVPTVVSDPSPPRPTSHGPLPVGFYNTTVPQAGRGGADAPATVFYPSLAGGEYGAPNASLAPYGTVVFAPGYRASRLAYWTVLHALASDGFVLFGVDYDPSSLPDTAGIASRVGYALDYLESENATASSRLYGMIDGGRLVSSGHSMGGGISVLAASRHPRFDAVVPLSPFILPPLFWSPNQPGDVVRNVFLPMQIIVGSADLTALPVLNADVLHGNGNCPKSQFTIIGADHTFSNPAHRQLVGKYVSLWLHYYLERDGSAFDALFGSGAQADEAAGLLTYAYCLDTAAVEVTPPVATILIGNTQPFTATVRDRVGTAWNAAVAWSTTGGIGSVDASGVFLAQEAGVGTVTATREGVAGSALVTTGPEVRPAILRAFLSGTDFGDLTIEWWKAAADGAPGGPLEYRVLRAIGDPAGPYATLSSLPASGAARYAYTCAACGHIPGDTNPLFLKVQSVDAGNNAVDSNLAARYVRVVEAGPTLLSVPLVQADDSIAAVLRTVWPSARSVRAFAASDAADPWKAFYADRSGDLDSLPFGLAFWVDLATAGQYALAGLLAEPPSLLLLPGWNLLAYASPISETVAMSMAGLPVSRVDTYDGSLDPYRLRAAQPGQWLVWGEGCWVFSSANALWVQD